MSNKDSLPTSAFSECIKDKALLKALDKLNFKKMTAVQALAIPPALKAKDLVVQASTGSGKTLSFVIPILHIMNEVASREEINYTFALVVTPTRELAGQIAEVFRSLDKQLNPCLLIGGMPYKKQLSALGRDPRIVVGTPGRILDFLKRKQLDIRDCELFVLDEADEMFSMGFYEDVEELIRQVPEHTQGLFVSATISPRIDMLAKRHLKQPLKIEAQTFEEKPPQIDHYFFSVGNNVIEKPQAVCDLIDNLNPTSALIFCNTKSETELVEAFLTSRNFNAQKINSDLNQRQRNKIMQDVRSGKLRLLIATDIAARGIDIAQIELVIQIAVPEQSESYVHRTGRTGRASRSGKAITLVGPFDFVNFKNLRNELDVEFQEFTLTSE